VSFKKKKKKEKGGKKTAKKQERKNASPIAIHISSDNERQRQLRLNPWERFNNSAAEGENGGEKRDGD